MVISVLFFFSHSCWSRWRIFEASDVWFSALSSKAFLQDANIENISLKYTHRHTFTNVYNRWCCGRSLLPVEPLSLIQSSNRCDVRLCKVVFPIIHGSLKLNFQVTEHPQLNGWKKQCCHYFTTTSVFLGIFSTKLDVDTWLKRAHTSSGIDYSSHSPWRAVCEGETAASGVSWCQRQPHTDPTTTTQNNIIKHLKHISSWSQHTG